MNSIATPKAANRTAHNIERELRLARRALARCTKDFWKANRRIAKAGVTAKMEEADSKIKAVNVQAAAKKAIKLLEPTIDELLKELEALNAPKDPLDDF